MDLKDFAFHGKTVWVTGAHQGIGLEIARTFSRLGARVYGIDKLFRATRTHPDFTPVGLDLTRAEDVERTLDRLLGESPRLDVLVSAAGILHMGNVEALTDQAWQETFDVNVSGAFRLFRRVAPLFKAARAGTIVTVSSNATHVPRSHMAAYGASKAALTSLSQSLALELAPFGVRCNVVSPGSTDTPMQRAMWSSPEGAKGVIAGDPSQFRLGIPLAKLAEPKDVARLVAFLASDLAGHITMQDILIDGGATLGA